MCEVRLQPGDLLQVESRLSIVVLGRRIEEEGFSRLEAKQAGEVVWIYVGEEAAGFR